jgi:hypothetical protein
MKNEFVSRPRQSKGMLVHVFDVSALLVVLPPNQQQATVIKWETTHRVTLLYQQLRQIGSILSSDTSNESNFTHDGLMLLWRTAVKIMRLCGLVRVVLRKIFCKFQMTCDPT